MKNVLLVVLVALLLVPLDAGAGPLKPVRWPKHEGRVEPFRWPKGSVVVIENRLGPEWTATVETVVAAWDATTPHLRFRIERRGSGCKSRPKRIVLCHDPNLPATGMSTNQHGWFKHVIHRSVIRINSAPVPADCPKLDGSHVVCAEMSAVICHEFGHSLGLLHNNRSGESCLSRAGYVIADGRITFVELPGPYDRQSLKMLYKRKGPGWP